MVQSKAAFPSYQEDFLDEVIPLPTFSSLLQQDVLVKTGDPSFDAETGTWREFTHFSVAMNKQRRQPICIALNIDQGLIDKTLNRLDNFFIDEAVGEEFQLDDKYYKDRNGVVNYWDKGHMAPHQSARWGATYEEAKSARDDSYSMTNVCLQHRKFNGDEWLKVENWVANLQLNKDGKVSVFSGPIYGSSYGVTPSYIHPPGRPEAEVPTAFFKIVSFMGKDGTLSTLAFIALQDTEALEQATGEGTVYLV